MSDEQSNQPRKVKDLKARLGRTIAPSTPGAVMPPGINLPTPPGAEAAAPAPAPTEGGIVPPNVPAPAIPAPPISALSAPLPAAKAVVEPPWVKQQREDEEKRRIEDEKRKKRAAADPFAAAAPAGPQAVRIVVDDSAIDAAETGKKGKNAATIVVVVLVALVAMFIGKSIGNTMATRESSNRGLDAAQSIYDQVQRGETTLTAVRTKVDSLIEGSQVGPGKTPHVDYDSLTALFALENPFNAPHFRATNYTVFDNATTDALLKYYNSTLEVFTRIDRLGRVYNVRSADGRRQLDASFGAASDFSRFPVGCVPVILNNRAACNLVFADVEHATAEGIPTRTRVTGSATNRMPFTNQVLGPDTSDKLVLLVNVPASLDVLGSSFYMHDRFVRDLNELKTALDTASQARADFRNELNRIRQLPRQTTF